MQHSTFIATLHIYHKLTEQTVALYQGLTVKVKVKVTLEQPTKLKLYCFFNLGARGGGGGGQRHAPATVPPGKTRYPLHKWPG